MIPGISNPARSTGRHCRIFYWRWAWCSPIVPQPVANRRASRSRSQNRHPCLRPCLHPPPSKRRVCRTSAEPNFLPPMKYRSMPLAPSIAHDRGWVRYWTILKSRSPLASATRPVKACTSTSTPMNESGTPPLANAGSKRPSTTTTRCRSSIRASSQHALARC
ncbi:hypothetical protein D3C76_851690 [compost metagenome]